MNLFICTVLLENHWTLSSLPNLCSELFISANTSCILFMSVWSSILNVPGESTLRRDFLRLQQENKERSEALKRQQAQLAAQRRDPEEHKRQLLHDRQKRIEEQKEQRRRLEEVCVLHVHVKVTENYLFSNRKWPAKSANCVRCHCQYKYTWQIYLFFL